MRILFWCDSFWPEVGGLEVFCRELSTALVSRGHACAVVTDDRTGTAGPATDRVGGVEIYRFPFLARLQEGSLPALRKLRTDVGQVVDKFAPDVIHANAHHCSVYFLVQQQKARRRPVVLTLHDRYLFDAQGPLGDFVFEDTRAVIAISAAMRDEILRFDPRLAEKVRLISNALPLPDLAPASLPSPPRLLAFGRIVREKGFDLAIEAFARVAAAFPETTLTIAGDGTELEALKALAEKAGLASRIQFPGWIDPQQIPALLNRHSAVLMPSRWQEPFGLVALQAAQMGRPIVASASGGIPEIVANGVTGHLFENENVVDFAAKLRALLESREEMEKIGRQARARAVEKFDFDRFVAAYEQIYAVAVAVAARVSFG